MGSPVKGTAGYFIYIYIIIYILSKEVGKQYFRVTNDFYLMQLTMMKGGRSQNNTLSNNTQQKNKKLEAMTQGGDEGKW